MHQLIDMQLQQINIFLISSKPLCVIQKVADKLSTFSKFAQV